MEGAKDEKATFAQDNQDTLPMDITQIPTPEEPKVTFSPPISSVERRAAFQGKTVKPGDNGTGACEGGSSVEETPGSYKEKDKTNLKAHVFDKATLKTTRSPTLAKAMRILGLGLVMVSSVFYKIINSYVRNDYLTHLAMNAHMRAPISKI